MVSSRRRSILHSLKKPDISEINQASNRNIQKSLIPSDSLYRVSRAFTITLYIAASIPTVTSLNDAFLNLCNILGVI